LIIESNFSNDLIEKVKLRNYFMISEVIQTAGEAYPTNIILIILSKTSNK
jgi:hypothetical protein